MVHHASPEEIRGTDDAAARNEIFTELGGPDYTPLLFEVLKPKEPASALDVPDDLSSKSIIGLERAHETPQWITDGDGPTENQ